MISAQTKRNTTIRTVNRRTYPIKNEIIDIQIIPGALHGIRKLNTQKNKHDTVEDEADYLPHAGKGQCLSGTDRGEILRSRYIDT